MTSKNGERVAIIGGGLSGLAVAWNLRGSGIAVDLYEITAQVGGNAYTANVAFDSVARFADLGVNDFNANSYTNIVEILDQLQIPYLDLEDTACFYSEDDSILYTLDGRCGTQMSAKLSEGFAFFRQQAPADYLTGRFQNASIEQYLATPPYAPYMSELAEQCIYPRVNAMYFCDETGARGMPFAAIMHYYMLQEGMGTPTGPDRKYWVGGTNAPNGWIQRLRQACGANVITGVSVKLIGQQPGWQVVAGGVAETYDKIVIACHPVDALGLFVAGLPTPASKVLSMFRYCPSTAVLHVWPGVLASNRNAWRTYNIRVRPDGESPSRYEMTYVENRHQNDAQNPPFDHYGLPEYYTSLNPHLAIPPELILIDAITHQPCVKSFPHNVVDLAAISAQSALPSVQGMNQIYYTGGWTNGAGLHEECWISAQNAANAILGRGVATDHLFDMRRPPGERAPRHVRCALGLAT